MSNFYKYLSAGRAKDFRIRKKAFKAGKPCAICGKRKKPAEMMVAHIIPASELTDDEALYWEGNWQVRCVECEMRLNHERDIKNANSKSNTTTA